MEERNISISISENNHWHFPTPNGGQWPIENIIAPHTLYRKHRQSLKNEKLLYLEQLIRYDKIITWKDYTKYTKSTNKGKISTWYTLIKNRTSNALQDIIHTSWQPFSLYQNNSKFKK